VARYAPDRPWPVG